MSSISSPLTGSNGTVYFTGLSNYAQDLNNAIARTVGIATLPIHLLQSNMTDMTNQSGELQKLSGDVSAVQSAILSLGAAASNMLSASIANTSVASVTLGSGATAGTYSLEVDNLGSASNVVSTGGVGDPSTQNLGAGGPYTLIVGGATISSTITPAADNLNSLAQAINDAHGGVQATVVNVGSDTTPSYVLSLQSDALGDVSMQVKDGAGTSLLGTYTAGRQAQYIVNGQSVSSGSDTVTLAPGLTVNLKGTNINSPTSIKVAAGTSNISGALASFASAYNTAMGELGNNRGQAGGYLTGQSIVYELTNTLRSLANYAGGDGNISSLAALGLKFNDATGVLTFDASIFSTATSGQIDALTGFLGSATGGGFLKVATDAVTSIEDPTSGYLSQDLLATNAQLQHINQQVTDKQNQVSMMQQNLIQQMAAADALIASMQQQATYYNDIFVAMQTANSMYSSNGR